MAGPEEDGAAAIDRWVAAYNANDLDALMKAYAPDAILQGTSEPQINVGTADLRKYFRNLPKGGSSNSIQERRMFVINDTTVLGVGIYTFKSGPARFSFLVVKRGNDWRDPASPLVVDSQRTRLSCAIEPRAIDSAKKTAGVPRQ